MPYPTSSLRWFPPEALQRQGVQLRQKLEARPRQPGELWWYPLGSTDIAMVPMTEREFSMKQCQWPIDICVLLAFTRPIIVDLPIKHGELPQLCGCLPEGMCIVTPLKNMRVDWDDYILPRYGDIKHVPNHQAENVVLACISFSLSLSLSPSPSRRFGDLLALMI